MIFSVFVLFLFFHFSTASELTNNGYDLLIAIDERLNATGHSRLITDLRKVFTKTSAELFLATKRRAHFKRITILVPSHWPEQREKASSNETFEKAEIRVSAAEPIIRGCSLQPNHSPYVKRTSKVCGQKGDYLKLTPEWIANETLARIVSGPQDKALVRMWGHYQWGLFDESPSDTTGSQHFYSSSNGKIEATRCGAHIKGTIRALDGRICDTTESEISTLNKNCRFFPERESEYGSSYLFLTPKFTKVNAFCDRHAKNRLERHNREAPNKQNAICDGKSAWEVMRQHPDFKNDKNPPLYSGETGNSRIMEPNFRIVQEFNEVSKKRFVFVLDTSGSMDDPMPGGQSMIKLQRAVQTFIDPVAPLHSFVGIVEFDNSATIISRLEEIKSDFDRQELRAKVKAKANGGTCIGCGILAGIQVLEVAGNKAKDGVLIVVTDGKDGHEKEYDEAVNKAKRTGVIISAILFTQSAEHELKTLAEQTGGSAHLFTGNIDDTALSDALQTITNTADQSKSNPSQQHQVLSEAVRLGPYIKEWQKELPIENGLGNNTKFIFTATSGSIRDVDVVVWSPTRKRFQKGQRDFREYGNVASIHLKGKNETGLWKIHLKSSRITTVQIQVISDPVTPPDIKIPITNKTDIVRVLKQIPISFEVALSLTEWKPSSVTGCEPGATIFASVTKVGVPVNNVTIHAELSPGNKRIPMFDNGVGADSIAGDGVYSGIILDVPYDRKTYNVKVIGKSGHSTGIDIAAACNENATKLNISDFERDTSPGAVRVQGCYGYHVPKIPAKIKDLRITGTSYDNATVILEFTAVGAKFDKGKVESYELRWAPSIDTIYDSFTLASKVSQENLTRGNLSNPGEPYSNELIEVRLEDRSQTIFFAIRAVNRQGNAGPSSNVVAVRLREVGSQRRQAIEKTEGNTILILVICLAVGVAAIAGIAVLVRHLVIQPKQEALTDSTTFDPQENAIYFNHNI